MSASGVQNIARGVHSRSTWDVAWDVLEDELLGMTLEMAVALRDSSCLGPQFQGAKHQEEHCEGRCWGCP